MQCGRAVRPAVERHGGLRSRTSSGAAPSSSSRTRGRTARRRSVAGVPSRAGGGRPAHAAPAGARSRLPPHSVDWGERGGLLAECERSAPLPPSTAAAPQLPMARSLRARRANSDDPRGFILGAGCGLHSPSWCWSAMESQVGRGYSAGRELGCQGSTRDLVAQAPALAAQAALPMGTATAPLIVVSQVERDTRAVRGPRHPGRRMCRCRSPCSSCPGSSDIALPCPRCRHRRCRASSSGRRARDSSPCRRSHRPMTWPRKMSEADRDVLDSSSSPREDRAPSRRSERLQAVRLESSSPRRVHFPG